MKKILITVVNVLHHLMNPLLVAILMILMLFFQILSGCRTIQKLTTKADSTSVRTAQSSEQWQREIIREYYPGPMRYDTIWQYDTLKVPHVIRIPTPYPVREIIREAGTKQEARLEEKQTTTQTQQKDTTTPFLVQAMMLLCALAVCGAIGMALLTILRR